MERRRAIEPIERTRQLVEIVYAASPKKNISRDSPQHPAMRTFQALRIFCNNEIGELEAFLGHVPKLLKPAGGCLAVVSYHSTEDRAVKRFLKGNQDLFEGKVGKPFYPTDAEISENPRARSARMRAAILR